LVQSVQCKRSKIYTISNSSNSKNYNYNLESIVLFSPFRNLKDFRQQHPLPSVSPQG
jgi:hypothetical protein